MTLGLKGRAVIGLLFACLCVLALIGAVAQAVGGLRTRVTNRRRDASPWRQPAVPQA